MCVRACRHVGDEQLVCLLISAKADVEAYDDAGQQPLHHSALQGFPHIVQLLLHCTPEAEDQEEHEQADDYGGGGGGTNFDDDAAPQPRKPAAHPPSRNQVCKSIRRLVEFFLVFVVVAGGACWCHRWLCVRAHSVRHNGSLARRQVAPVSIGQQLQPSTTSTSSFDDSTSSEEDSPDDHVVGTPLATPRLSSESLGLHMGHQKGRRTAQQPPLGGGAGVGLSRNDEDDDPFSSSRPPHWRPERGLTANLEGAPADDMLSPSCGTFGCISGNVATSNTIFQ